MKLIYKPWGSDSSSNPKGYPSWYPLDSMLIDDKDTIPNGWVLTTDDEYKKLIQDGYEMVFEINSQIEEENRSYIESKASSLESTFNQIQSIKDKVEGAGGKLESADQTALLLYTLETLLLLREPLVQIQKRSL